MLLVLFYIFFNILILLSIFLYVSGIASFFGSNWLSRLTFSDIFLLSLSIEVLLVALGASKLGGRVLKSLIQYRTLTLDEKTRLIPLLQRVLIKHNQLLGTSYNGENFNLSISDSNQPNATIYGRNYLILSKGMLLLANDDELQAVISECLGYIWFYNGTKEIIKIFANLPLMLGMKLYQIIYRILGFFSGINQLLLIIAAFICIVLLPFVLLSVISSKLFVVFDSIANKEIEYKVDLFIAKLGYKNQLISLLNKLSLAINPKNTFLEHLFARCKPAKERILRLENFSFKVSN